MRSASAKMIFFKEETMQLTNEQFDRLRWIAQIGLPAFITFIAVVLQTINAQYTEEILTILTAFDAFMGALLQVKRTEYNSAARG